jgi:ATP/maltotriose-dependent transcriptional regulator MalT
MNERFAERIREAQDTIEVLRRVHPANHPNATQLAEFFELHAAHERERGRTENAERAAQRAARLRENPSDSPA